MEGENSNIKKHQNVPSNYVTLLQLQERWVKEKQRKQKEKEEEEEAAKQNQKQKQKQKQEENQEPEQKPEDAQPIDRISNQRYYWRSRNLKVVDAGAHRKETNAAVSASVLVEENRNESGVNKEVRSEGLRNKKKSGRKKKKKKEKDGEEARARNKEKVDEEQGQEETGRDAHAPPVIPARRSERKSEIRVECGPKINDVVETGDATVEEMDEKFGDLSIGKAIDRLSLQRQNRVINHRDRAYRGYNSGVYRRNGHYSHRGGYEIGAHRGIGHYKGGNWKFNRGNGQGTGGYRRFNGYGGRNMGRDGMVWVRKDEGADGGAGGDVAENQSSGGSFRELE